MMLKELEKLWEKALVISARKKYSLRESELSGVSPAMWKDEYSQCKQSGPG